MGKVVNFHLPADDVERAATFYREVFGWEFTPFPNSPVPYLVNDSGEGANGAGIPAAITTRQEIVKAPVPTIEVDNIDEALISVVLKGGQQAQVQEIPGLGRFAYAIDSEGNIIALLQRTT
ncbi:MAG TPA: VOC family protein [Candidatus Elarobacter sp.]|nr:VOC family protein [Candidatus Elarobacter sp.]